MTPEHFTFWIAGVLSNRDRNNDSLILDKISVALTKVDLADLSNIKKVDNLTDQ